MEIKRAFAVFDHWVIPMKTALLDMFRPETIEETWEKSRSVFLKYGLDPSQCTCLKCPDKETCAFAFDIQNYDGYCLGKK